jgi:hypothetical protein
MTEANDEPEFSPKTGTKLAEAPSVGRIRPEIDPFLGRVRPTIWSSAGSGGLPGDPRARA